MSALVGVDSLRNDAANVFHTGSYWYSAGPMAAAIATLGEWQRLDAPRLLGETGRKLNDGLIRIAKSHGYTRTDTGGPCMAHCRIPDDETMMLHQRWCAECTRRGAYFAPHHNWFVCAAMEEADIKKTLNVASECFKLTAKKF